MRGRLPTRILLALLGCGARLAAADPGPSHQQASDPAARCAALIGLFDEIIISRFDYQILKLEDYELAEARSWRDRAESECSAGRTFFGTGLITSALRQIGVVPELDDPRRPAPR